MAIWGTSSAYDYFLYKKNTFKDVVIYVKVKRYCSVLQAVNTYQNRAFLKYKGLSLYVICRFFRDIHLANIIKKKC